LYNLGVLCHEQMKKDITSAFLFTFYWFEMNIYGPERMVLSVLYLKTFCFWSDWIWYKIEFSRTYALLFEWFRFSCLHHRYLSKPRWGTKQNVWGKSLCILYGSCAKRNEFYCGTLISNILLQLWQICLGVCSVIVLLQMRKQQPTLSLVEN
jgi:hypothetical protein